MCLYVFPSQQRRHIVWEHERAWGLRQKDAGQDSVRLRNGKSQVGGGDQRLWQEFWLPCTLTGTRWQAERLGRRERAGEKHFSCLQRWAGSQKHAKHWMCAWCRLSREKEGMKQKEGMKKKISKETENRREITVFWISLTWQRSSLAGVVHASYRYCTLIAVTQLECSISWNF